MNKEEIKHFKAMLRQGSLRHMNILLDDKFQKELLNIIKDYEKLQQENKELQEELQKADSITQSCIFNGKKESELNFRQSLNLVKELRKENKELHNKIDKAIEYINDTLCCIHDEELLDDLLGILKDSDVDECE